MLIKAEVIEQRDALLNDMEELTRAESIDENALTEKRGAVEKMNIQIETLEALEVETEERDELAPVIIPENKVKEMTDNKERNEVFGDYLRGNAEAGVQLRAMDTSTANKGGVTVPTDMAAEIKEKREASNSIRALADVQNIGAAGTFPIEKTLPTFGVVSEGSAFGQTDAEIEAWDASTEAVGGIIKVSEKLANNSAYDMEAHVAKASAKAMRGYEEGRFATTLASEATEVETATASTLAAADIMDLLFSVKAGYAAEGSFLFSMSAFAAVRALYKADTQVFTLELIDGRYFLEGKPVYFSDGIAAYTGADEDVVGYFGDFDYFCIAEADEIEIRVLGERYADTAQIGIRVSEYIDDKLLVAEAISKLVVKATA